MSILTFTANIVSLAYVGHLSARALAAAVLGTRCVGQLKAAAAARLRRIPACQSKSQLCACSLYNVTGFSILIGLSSAMETLCGQVTISPACPWNDLMQGATVWLARAAPVQSVLHPAAHKLPLQSGAGICGLAKAVHPDM